MQKNSVILLVAVFLTFFALGMPDGAFGVAWPLIRYDMGLPLGDAVSLIVIHSIFYSVSSSQIGRLAKYLRLDFISLYGFALLLVGILGFAISPNFIGFKIATAVFGTGMGMIDGGLNAFAAKRLSAKHMNWMHCFWGLGGSVSPVIMGLVAAGVGWRFGYASILAVQAVIFIFVAFTIFKGLWVYQLQRSKPASAQAALPPNRAEDEVEENGEAAFLTAMRFPVLQLVIFFFYTAFEYSVTFWTVSVFIESRGVYFETAALLPAFYLGFLMFGRSIFGYVTDKVASSYVIRLGLIFAACGLVVLIFSGGSVWAFVGISMVGFGFAPVFPCLMDETKRRFNPKILAKLVGLQVAAAGAGVAIGSLAMERVLALVSLNALYPMVLISVVVVFSLNEFIEISLKYKI